MTLADARSRHEHQIKSFGVVGCRAFEDALTGLAFKRGLSWFSDEQIADMREHLIRGAWRRFRITRENHRLWAARHDSPSAGQVEGEW